MEEPMLWYATAMVLTFTFGFLGAALLSASARGERRHEELMTTLGGDHAGIGRSVIQGG
ncbi:MAG: hypothetical protein P8170_21990 [Gemmatimonadota bacterium]